MLSSCLKFVTSTISSPFRASNSAPQLTEEHLKVILPSSNMAEVALNDSIADSVADSIADNEPINSGNESAVSDGIANEPEPVKRKRGRPPKGTRKVPAAPKPTNGVPKKRGRPKKEVSAPSSGEETDGQNGGPVDVQGDDDEPQPKKRGRKPGGKNKPKAAVTASSEGTPKRRGRPPKNATSDTPAKAASPKKNPTGRGRGRPKKSETAAAAKPNGTSLAAKGEPKKRGRPAKAKAAELPAGSATESSSASASSSGSEYAD